MNLWHRMVITRRYAPFLVLALAQLVLVLVAPSVAPTASSQFGGYSPGSAAGLGTQGSTATGASPGATAGGGTGAAGGGAGGGASNPGGAPVAANSLGIPLTGDTSHCVHGQQFGDLTSAPPCVPKWPGGNNGGATYQGVTATTIEVVYYREKDNPAVKALEQQIGVYSDPTDQMNFKNAAAKFINSRYELYGRKVQIDMYLSASCDPSPPHPDCFRNDVRALNQQYHPFAVLYENNTAIPEFFDEAAKLGIVSFGGWHFSDQVFNNPLQPYHYDALMGGDSQAQITGEYWCKRLAGKPARFAGATLQATKRKVAVITVNTAVNKPAGQHLADIIHGCDPNFDENADFVTYESDITTSSQQANTLVHQLSSDGVTSILFFGDPIAPVYFTAACTSQAYFPEHVLVGSGLIDNDQLGRLYDKQQWAHAFGPSDIATPLPIDKTDAGIVWRAAGNTSALYNAATVPWGYFNMIANGLEEAGPHLDPGSFQRGALSAPPLNVYASTHDPYHYESVLGQNKYTALTDQREVYWDANAVSPTDGQKGAYVTLNNGRRYAPGQWPGGEPNLPAGV